MAIFHYTVKIVGRSKGKSIISASAYLNGDVMKNEETGRISYYTSKKEVVYTSLLMCENAPQEWQNVPAENIRRFQKSVRYKRADNQNAALEKFKLTFQKQRLWNEVLRIEKSSDAQLGRSFEFSLPKEWSRQEQIDYTTEYIQKTFVDKGMCADWSIHDKGDGNPHVHLLVTMRPFNSDHSWGNKEIKDWEFVRDENGNIVRNLDPVLVRRTISEDVSAQMRQFLKNVVSEGTGKKATVEGYEIGGKTGTAEKLPRGNGKYILSFIGFAPVDDPQVVIYVVADEPELQSGSGEAAHLFADIAEAIFPYLNIYKTDETYDIDEATAEDEPATPIYGGEAPANDVAGGSDNPYVEQSEGETTTETTTEDPSPTTEAPAQDTTQEAPTG